MRRAEPEQSIAEEVDEILEGVEARECHNFIRDTNQKVENLQRTIKNIEEKSVIEDQKLQLMDYQRTIETLKSELLASEKIMHLMNDDIVLKNRLILEKKETIGNLRRRFEPQSAESVILKKVNRLESDDRRQRETILVYETQNILLIKEVASLNSQLNHWRHLYEEIKNTLAEKIELSLESKEQRGGTSSQV